MAIQHAGGTLVDNSWTGATRTAIADGIKGDLVTAGWTVASGSSGDWKLDSDTSAQGLQMRVRLYDPGSGNCACIRIMNVGETVTPATDVYLLPGAAKTFHVIANRYQCFVVVPGSTAARDFAAFGLPYLPAHIASPSSGYISEAGWLVGNANGDADGTTRDTFRTYLSQIIGNYAVFCNGNSFSGSGHFGVPGLPRLPGFVDVDRATSAAFAGNGIQWHDDSYMIMDALIGWGLTSYNDATKWRGQLWGAFIDSADRSADTTFTFDDGNGSHTYFVITSSNTNTGGRGTLCVAVD